LRSLWEKQSSLLSPKSDLKNIWDTFSKRAKPFLEPKPLQYQVKLHDGSSETVTDEYAFMKAPELGEMEKIDRFTGQLKRYYKDFEKVSRYLRKQLQKDLNLLENYAIESEIHPIIANMAVYNDDWIYFSFHDPELVILRMKLPDSEQKLISLVESRELENIVTEQYHNIRSKKGPKNLPDYISSFEIVFDENAIISQLKNEWIANGRKHKLKKSTDPLSISPDQKFVCYWFEFGGYYMLIININTGDIVERVSVQERITSVEFSKDSRKIYYVVANSQHRPYKVMAHQIQVPGGNDIVLLEENEEPSFYLELYRSKDHACLFINSGNRSTSECFIIDEMADIAKLIKKRKKGELFFPEHNGRHIFAITNIGNTVNLQVIRLESFSNPEQLVFTTLLSANPETMIDDIEMFRNYLLLYEKKLGLNQIRIINMDNYADQGVINVPECSTIQHFINRRFNSYMTFLQLSSIINPGKLYLIDFNKKHLQLIIMKKEDETYSRLFKQEDFTVYQVYVPSSVPNSKVKIPMVLVHEKDIKLNGNNPVLIIGYGAYGFHTDLSFEMQRLLLLKNKFVIAFAQVRGGGDVNFVWHQDGSVMNKKNSFLDFIDCTKYLIDNKYTEPSLICAKGISAGGLLVASSALMRPDLYKSVLLKVPFLDITSTMLDTSLPLTSKCY
jgi:protease II